MSSIQPTEQFEIVGLDRYTVPKKFLVEGRVAIKGKPTHARILICKKNKVALEKNSTSCKVRHLKVKNVEHKVAGGGGREKSLCL